jgi:hypothetical protein
MNIGICILATNSYFVLGIRFIKKFIHHYKGDKKITFYFFSDTKPTDYLPENIDVEYFYISNNNWVDGTNLKFNSILSIGNRCKSNYLYYFDADTNITSDFDEDWFIGEMVGGQHFADQSYMKEIKGYDRNPKSQAYIPFDTLLPQIYFYGAFFGGDVYNVLNFVKKLSEYQKQDKLIPYEPGVNDESYINKEFHYNPPSKVILCQNFKFNISDKGGIGDTRNMKLNIDSLKDEILKNKNNLFDIRNGEFILL